MSKVHKHSLRGKSHTPGRTAKPRKKPLIDDPIGHHIFQNTGSDAADFIKIKESRVIITKERTLVFSAIGLILSLALIIGMFEWRTTDRNSAAAMDAPTESFEDLMEIPQTEQMQPPPPQVQSPRVIEVSDEEIIEEIQVELDIEMTEDTRIEEVIYDDTEDQIPEEKADEIFTIVEEHPAPSGGMEAFYQFVAENMQYPAQARRMGIEGRVFVQFVVEKDGSLSDIQTVKGIGGGCDEEAERVISAAPHWKPGKQRGRPVRVRMILPIVFKLIS
jgi:protein TonB